MTKREIQVGDTVIITNQILSIYGGKCTVVHTPTPAYPHLWVTLDGGNKSDVFCLSLGEYRFDHGIERLCVNICPDCRGTGVIELFTSAQKCPCKEK